MTRNGLMKLNKNALVKIIISLQNKLDEINSIIEYWGYDKNTNDVSCFRRAMQSIKEILESKGE